MDTASLELAESENGALVAMDKDFGEFIYLRRVTHAGLVLLPDVRAAQRIEAARAVVEAQREALEERNEPSQLRAEGEFEFPARRGSEELPGDRSILALS